MKKKRLLLLMAIGIALGINVPLISFAASSSSKAMTAHQDTEEGLVEISPQGQKMANIVIETLTPRRLPLTINAPGEVVINSNYSAIVTSRIRAQVLKRLVNVGETVKKGMPLVELTSVEMAQAQGQLLLATKEWQRVKSLGREAVSAKRYQEAEVAYQQAFAKLIAYGMTQAQVKTFIQSDNPNKADGTFTLLSPRHGKVFSADFTEGQMIEPGNPLYKVVDESKLWVNAQLSNGDSDTIKSGDKAWVKTAHETWQAQVLQVHPQLDEATRTQIVRLVVNNPNSQLRPGEFVTCQIQTGNTGEVLAVPQRALVRTPDGDQAVYLETQPNHFKAQEVKVIKSIGAWKVIQGVQAGARIVVRGAFFVHSEAMKSGFSIHNH